jgi:16S rRNA (cytosine1402-N4)-methyltransferase
MAVTARPFLSPLFSLSPKALRWKTTNAIPFKHCKASAAGTEKSKSKSKPKALVLEKRRTRSGVEVDLKLLRRFKDDNTPHLPVLLCEVLRAFKPLTLRSFVDCTVGAASHSSAVIHHCSIPFLFFVFLIVM